MKSYLKFIYENKFTKSFSQALPHRILQNRRVKFSELLPYEDVFKTKTREIFILQPMALCCGWELDGIYHELEDNNSLESKINQILENLNQIKDDRITIQILTDKGKDNDPEIPFILKEPKTISQKICKIQCDHLVNSAGKLMKTKIYLFLRLEIGNFDITPKFSDNIEDIYREHEANIADSIEILELNADSVEKSFENRMKYKKMDRDSFKYFIKKWTHSTSDFHSKEVQEYIKHDNRKSLRDQISENYIEFSPHAVNINGQIIQGISWKNIPTEPKIKTMIHLLSTEEDILLCVSMRPTSPGISQVLKQKCLGKRGNDDIELKELNSLMDDYKKGKTLWETSIHVLIRHEESEEVNLETLKTDRKLRKICNDFFDKTKITWIEEKDNFPQVYLSCLPFFNNKYITKFVGRSFPISNTDFAPYFIAYSSFKGTGIEHGGMAHLNRANELIFVNSRIYEMTFNMHQALFGISGSGKSVLTVYDILAEVAYNNSYIFIIDSQTSGEILARVLAFNSKSGISINKPPEKFPNPFSGQIDEDRAKVISSIISSSLDTLTSETLDPKESTLLIKTILYAYKSVVNSSQSVFQFELEKKHADFETIETSKLYIDKNKEKRSLRMQDVISYIAEVGALDNYKNEIVFSLKDKLSPFYGSGQFSKIFDQISYEKSDEDTPCVTIYDLCELQRQPILLTVTTQVITNEVMRHIYMKKNQGRCGYLVIDEAGVNLGGNNEELAKFVENAFAVLRKKRVKCAGIDNNMQRYTTERALRAIWDGSETKIVLAMGRDRDTAEKFVFGQKDMLGNYLQAPLIKEDRYVELLPSLDKKASSYADILFHGKSHKGTFSFSPCGFLYWLSVNKDVEKNNFNRVVDRFGSMDELEAVWSALNWLSENFPNGKYNSNGDPLPFEEQDLSEIKNIQSSLFNENNEQVSLN